MHVVPQRDPSAMHYPKYRGALRHRMGQVALASDSAAEPQVEPGDFLHGDTQLGEMGARCLSSWTFTAV
jgi:hypothetical protein